MGAESRIGQSPQPIYSSHVSRCLKLGALHPHAWHTLLMSDYAKREGTLPTSIPTGQNLHPHPHLMQSSMMTDYMKQVGGGSSAVAGNYANVANAFKNGYQSATNGTKTLYSGLQDYVKSQQAVRASG